MASSPLGYLERPVGDAGQFVQLRQNATQGTKGKAIGSRSLCSYMAGKILAILSRKKRMPLCRWDIQRGFGGNQGLSVLTADQYFISTKNEIHVFPVL